MKVQNFAFSNSSKFSNVYVNEKCQCFVNIASTGKFAKVYKDLSESLARTTLCFESMF